MSDAGREEFYVGYLERAPAGLARRTRALVVVLAAAGVALAAALAGLQRPFARATYEYGSPRSFEGRLELAPVPVLAVARPAAESRSRYLLVAPGKHGAGPLVAAHDGQDVALEGTLVHRDGETMIEVVPGSVRPLAADAAAPPPAGAPVAMGKRTLEGEIVDSKCFLGVMKPGELKPHRDCASLCIRGGVPPVLCVRDADGRAEYWLLVSAEDTPVNYSVLPFVAEPVRVTGQAERRGDALYLRIDPTTIQRVRAEEP